jgi:hypothetical protein
MKYGIIGDGYWGKIIKSKLKDVEFCINSNTDYRSVIDSVDVVFVCTPSYTHYEIVSYCLSKQKHVFCEKPCTGKYNETMELFKLADKNKVGLYVDDLFVNRDELKSLPTPNSSIIIETKKYGSFTDTIFNSLVYHDLTMLNRLIGLNVTNLHLPINERNKKHITFTVDGIEVNLIYDRVSETKSKVIVIDGITHDLSKPTNDPLIEVINEFLEKPTVKEGNRDQTIKIDEILQNLNSQEKHIAIVGAGIFGCTIAIKLGQIGYNVTLFEQDSDILQRASSINQYRLHRGFHYPRSLETANESTLAEGSFIKMYGSAISSNDEHYYCIANDKSKTTPEEYLEFLATASLDYELILKHPVNNVGMTIKVDEYLMNPNVLKSLCWDKLNEVGVNIKLNTQVKISDIKDDYDKIIVATYASINSVLDDDIKNIEYQFELCEKPILKLPSRYTNKSIVIMDGPFMCIDPLVDTDYHVMGNVKHAIHHTNNGKSPIIPDEFKGLLNKGVVENPSVTNIDKFIESASEFFDGIEDYTHIGSMYTIRTVLPNRDHDDARPSVVREVSDDVITIFSGKIGTCVKVANKVIELIKK